MTKINILRNKWMQDKAYQEAYEALEDEFALAAALIEARSRAGLTQGELVERMHTTQSAVASIEGGYIRIMEEIAKATNSASKSVLSRIRLLRPSSKSLTPYSNISVFTDKKPLPLKILEA